MHHSSNDIDSLLTRLRSLSQRQQGPSVTRKARAGQSSGRTRDHRCTGVRPISGRISHLHTQMRAHALHNFAAPHGAAAQEGVPKGFDAAMWVMPCGMLWIAPECCGGPSAAHQSAAHHRIGPSRPDVTGPAPARRGLMSCAFLCVRHAGSSRSATPKR